jgi:hypothetical protein
MKPDEPQIQRIEKSIREIHEYARHTMQTFTAFFTFFVAMNYATMGFLAKDGDGANQSKLVSLIARIFIYQNILAIVSCVVIAVYLFRANRQLLDYQEFLNGPEVVPSILRQSVLPKWLYIGVILLSFLTFAGMIVAWLLYKPFH